MTEHVTKLEISTASILKFFAILIFFVFLYLLKDVVLIFLFAVIIASAIAPVANWLESKRIPRVFGVLALYLVVFGLMVLLLSLVVPFVTEELTQLSSSLPELVAKITGSLDNVQEKSKYFNFLTEMENILESFSGYLQQFSRSAFGLVVSIFGGLYSFVAVVIISFYLSVMRGGLEAFMKSVIPAKYEVYVIRLWTRSEAKVGRWLQGQLLLALIVGLAVFIGLSLLGVKYALLLALISMILEIVPIAGPVLAAIPGVLVGFLTAPTLGLWVLLFYFLVQQLENHLLAPVILGRTTGMNPVAVIIALLIGGSLAGIIGMLIAVPVATVIVEVLDDMAKQKELKRGST